MVDEITTLAIDSSSPSMSAALLYGSEIVVEKCVDTARHHAETIISTVEAVLKAGGKSIAEVDLYAVVSGPGSFTGLRVGISTIKGFALALGKPIAAVSALEALAYNAAVSTVPVCAMIDAKHDLVYTAVYRFSGDGSVISSTAEEAVKPEEYLTSLDGEILFLGDGVRRYSSLIETTLSERARYAAIECDQIRAGVVGLIGLKKLQCGDIVDSITMTPAYVRAFSAKPGVRHTLTKE